MLVVVLIIGILAAVAVPQYNKAVYKAHAASLIALFDTYQKAISLYVLEHGIEQVFFTGNWTEATENATLDLSVSSEEISQLENYYSGSFTADCSTIDNQCTIHYVANWTSDGDMPLDTYLTLTDASNGWQLSQCVAETPKGEAVCALLQ